MQLATNLGTVLAAEEFCGMKYDGNAIAAFIEKNVAANDMSFPSTLKMMVDGSKFNLSGMSTSEKVAHCSQIKRIAQSYGFQK
jgi:hypothetical protein